MQTRHYTFTFASGATSTNKMYVGNFQQAALVLSATTNYNAGTGNATFFLRGGLSDTDTHVVLRGHPAGSVASASIATITAKGIYHYPFGGPDYMSVEFGTAVTGSSSNTLEVVVFES